MFLYSIPLYCVSVIFVFLCIGMLINLTISVVSFCGYVRIDSDLFKIVIYYFQWLVEFGFMVRTCTSLGLFYRVIASRLYLSSCCV